MVRRTEIDTKVLNFYREHSIGLKDKLQADLASALNELTSYYNKRPRPSEPGEELNRMK